MRYAYLGPEGTFTEAALKSLPPGAEPVEPVGYPTIQAALAAVRDRAVDRAVVALESSVEGIVTATVDNLAAGDLVIQSELRLPIAFALLTSGPTELAKIKTVSGHPQALAQCRHWLHEHLPHAEQIPAASNAEAARRVAEGGLDAALAGAFAADKYGLTIAAADVQDSAAAVTRFVVVSRAGEPLPAPTATDRTSLAVFLEQDHAGALMEILTEFAVRGISLTTIQSRPTGAGLGSYYFFIDCEGHVDDARVGEALMGLRRVCGDVRFLGSYPRCDGGATHVRPGTSDQEFAEAAAWLGRLRYGRSLQVGARGPRWLLRVLGGHHAGRERPAHLLQLGPRGHLLREQGRLYPVEQPLEPADELRLGDPELALARRHVVGEWQRQPLELIDQFGRQPVLEFLDGRLVDLLQPLAALLVERRGADLLEQLPDHAADPHHLGRLLDHLGDRPLPALVPLAATGGKPVGSDHEDLRVLALARGRHCCFAHAS
jgi:prephenate dehydratase